MKGAGESKCCGNLSLGLLAVVACLGLTGCSGNFQTGNPEAIQNSPSHFQSTEGRLCTTRGTIRYTNGRYALFPTQGGQPIRLNSQSYAESFAGAKVAVDGYCNYDTNSIQVVRILPGQ